MGFTSTHGKWINVFFVVTHCIFVAIIFYDNRSRQQSPKVIGMAIWMIPVITGKRRCGSALSIKARHGNILASERREAGGAELFFHNLITQFVGMLH